MQSQSTTMTTATSTALVAAAAGGTAKEETIMTVATAEEIATLPLIKPFQIKNPAQSTIINTIINEQHTHDSLLLLIQQREKLHKESLKIENDDVKEQKKDNKSSNKGVLVSKGGGGGGGKKNKIQLSKEAIQQMKDIDNQIEIIQRTIDEQRQVLVQFTNWTKAMLQAEYSKLVISMDMDSPQYIELEEALSFLCPREGGSIGGRPNDGTEEYFHEQRLAYVKELIPVIKKIGDKGSITPEAFLTLPYLQKFQCCDETGTGSSPGESQSPIINALMDEMYQLSITEGIRIRLDKQLDDMAKLKVMKHVEEMLDRKEIVTSELVRKHYRKRSIKLHPDRNGEVRVVFVLFFGCGGVNMQGVYANGINISSAAHKRYLLTSTLFFQ